MRRSAAARKVRNKGKMLDVYQQRMRGENVRDDHHPFAQQSVPKREKYLKEVSKDLEHKPQLAFSGPFTMDKHLQDNLARYSRLYVLSRPGGGMSGLLKRMNKTGHLVKIFLARDKANGNRIVGWSCCYKTNLLDVSSYVPGGIEEMSGGPVAFIREHHKIRGGPGSYQRLVQGPYVGFLHVNVDVRYRGQGMGGTLAKMAKDYADKAKLFAFVSPVDQIGTKMFSGVGVNVFEDKRPKVGSAELPVLTKEKLWHVGDLKNAPKIRSTSYEGPGLSVSEHPQAWIGIAKLGGGKTYIGRRTDGQPGRFFDFLKMTKEQKKALTARAVEAGLLEPATIYRHRDYNEEIGHHSFDYETAEEAKAEHGSYVKVKSHKATPTLHAHWKKHFTSNLSPVMHAEMAWSKLLEDSGEYDGMWWSSKFQPSRLSAPAGVIFPSKLTEWTWKVQVKPLRRRLADLLTKVLS